MKIDANKIIEERLAASMGLDKYDEIMRQVNTVDVSRDADFQRQFNGFYIVRRNADWRKIYYELFETMKTEPVTFAIIITKLFEKTGNIEASFSSKMLATLNPDKPIWDRYYKSLTGRPVSIDRQYYRIIPYGEGEKDSKCY